MPVSDDINAQGKYLLLSVPDFATDPIADPDPNRKMSSYLRLGASSTTWKDDPGGFLEDLIYQMGPPGGHLNPTSEPCDTNGEDRAPNKVFIDDDRYRGGAAGHGLSEATRQDHSSWIHDRGGWRDHSDGNRISTTYGDKIEIIRGNYKMLVFGRQHEDPTVCAGWDASGHHIQDFANTMPGASIRVEWMQDRYNGAWHLQNTTEGVVQSSNFAGDFYEYWWGNEHQNYVGQEVPVPVTPDGEYPRQNPMILDKTFATWMKSYTGSSKCPVPEIYEELWATEVTTDTHIDTLKETSTLGTSDSTTTADSISETTDVGDMSSTTTAGSIEEITTAGAITEVTTAGAVTAVNTLGVQTEVTAAAALISAEFAANKTELFIGATHFNAEITALAIDIFAGIKLELTLAAAIAVNIGVSLDFTMGRHLSLVGSDKTNVTPSWLSMAILHAVVSPSIQLG